MRRRDLLAAALMPQPDEFGLRLYRAYSDLQDLVKAYFGCEADAPVLSETFCKAYRAQLDRSKYAKARKSAAKFFDIKE